MADEGTLKFTKPIPSQVFTAGASITPLNLKEYIETSVGEVHFKGELTSGAALPKGLMVTADGLFTGIPDKSVTGVHEIRVIVEDNFGRQAKSEFAVTIRDKMDLESPEFMNVFKTQVWEALGKNLPLPEIDMIFDRPITAIEIYYLLQRFATLTIWDVYNLEKPGPLVPVSFPDLNEHFKIYDRGCCIVAAPKELFSHARTLEHALQASRVLAREAYKRGWVIEFAGFDKMVRAAWVEIQLLGDKHNKPLEVLHFSPSMEDVKIYQVSSQSNAPSSGA